MLIATTPFEGFSTILVSLKLIVWADFVNFGVIWIGATPHVSNSNYDSSGQVLNLYSSFNGGQVPIVTSTE